MNQQRKNTLYKLTLAILASSLIAVLIVFKIYAPDVLVPTGHLIASPENVKDEIEQFGEPLSAVGESIIPRDMIRIEDRIRTAALIDALRKMALKKKNMFNRQNGAAHDTTKIMYNWSGLIVDAETIRYNGVVIHDEISLKIKTESSDAVNCEWNVNNLKLMRPPKDTPSNFETLSEALQKRGFEHDGGRRIGQNIWHETIREKEWKLRTD